MAQPPAYERSTSFANYQSANPSAPLPGADVDAELNNIKITLDALLANIAQIQRDDGDLGNETVGREQLKADLNIGFNQPTAWATDTAYAATVDSVFFAGIFYRCIEDHTSDVFADDLAAEKWEEIADLTSVPLATAAQIEVTPTGDITGTDVQAALAELAADPETEVASGAVTPIGGAKTSRVAITGTTTITAFDTVANRLRFVRFADALTLTHGASLALPGGVNVATEANDTALFVSDSLGAWRCAAYRRANDLPVTLVEQTVASAATADIGTLRARRVTITGTTSITSFGAATNRVVFGRFEGALTLTHHSTSLILPGGKDISTAAGDCFVAASDASGNWRVLVYTRANGHSLRTAYDTIASASTTDLGSKHAEELSISGTTTINSFGSSAPNGARKSLRFEGELTLTHNGTSLILPTGANIATAAGDTAVFRHEGSGNWRCTNYQAAGAPVKVASQSSAEAGTAQTGLMDQLRTKQAIKALAPFGSQLLHVREEQTAGTNGGRFTSGSFVKRTLNTTLTNQISEASISSSVITLPAGRYYIEARAPGVGVSGFVTRFKARLRNTTDNADVLIGASVSVASSGATGSVDATVSGQFTLAAQKTLEFQHRTENTQADTGLGEPANLGAVEVYAEVKIWKLD